MVKTWKKNTGFLNNRSRSKSTAVNQQLHCDQVHKLDHRCMFKKKQPHTGIQVPWCGHLKTESCNIPVKYSKKVAKMVSKPIAHV